MVGDADVVTRVVDPNLPDRRAHGPAWAGGCESHAAKRTKSRSRGQHARKVATTCTLVVTCAA